MTKLELIQLLSNVDDDQELRLMDSETEEEYDFTNKIRHTIYSVDFLKIEKF